MKTHTWLCLCLLLWPVAAYAQTAPALVNSPQPDPQAVAHRARAQALAAKYDYAGAIGEMEQAYALDKSAHLHDAAADLNNIGVTYYRLSRYDKALDYMQQALPVLRQTGDKVGEANTLGNLGAIYSVLSRPDKALDADQQALTLQRQIGDKAGEAGTLGNLGTLYDRLSQYKKALDCFGQALLIQKQLGRPAGEAITLSNLGAVYGHLSQYPKALDYYAQALTLFQQIGDKAGEATTLGNIGSAYNSLSQYQKALDYFGQALPLQRQVGNHAGEAVTLNNLGEAYDNLSQYQKALDYYAQALPIRRLVGDRQGEAITLSNLGTAYSSLSQYQKALEYYAQALPIEQQIGDKAGEAITLNNLGASYRQLSQYAKALDYYNQALPIEQQIGDKNNEASTLNNIGLANGALSQYAKSLDYFTQALPLFQGVGDKAGEAVTLSNLGAAYAELGRYDRSLDFYGQSLPLERQIGDKAGEATALNNLGAAYDSLGRYDQALHSYGLALPIQKQIGDRVGEANTLNNLGETYSSLGQFSKGLAFYRQALPIFQSAGDSADEAGTLANIGAASRELGLLAPALAADEQALALRRQVGDRAGEALTLNNLMFLGYSLGKPRLAIFYGKQAVNAYQGIRADLGTLDAKTRKSYLASHENTYRKLAGLLIRQGRLPEAQHVIALLKEEEFFDFVRRDAKEAPASGHAELSPAETGWQARYTQIADQVTALGAERAALRANLARTPAQEARLTVVNADLQVARRGFEQFLTQLTGALGAAPQAMDKVKALQDAVGMQSDLRKLGSGTVALYTLVGEDKYRVLLVTPDTQKAEEYPIKATDLRAKVARFQQALQDPHADPRPLARQLYTVLFCNGALTRDLDGVGARTLMWSLDDALRYLPMAALSDGKAYLVERYRNTVFTPVSNARLKDPVSPHWKGLGLGVSKPHGSFPALPGAAAELNGIIGGPGTGGMPGNVDLDEAFTKAAMQTALGQGYPLVHIASHFQFAPGDETTSYLLLGDGSHLSLADINSQSNLFDGVELLTLSACNTGMGDVGSDGKEVEGLGVIAQRQGAEAVLASLWSVSDASTSLLMQQFYRLREAGEGTSKAEALRQAQLSLLHGSASMPANASHRGTEAVPSRGESAALPPFTPDPKAPYAHPFYWAPFILIGNWR